MKREEVNEILECFISRENPINDLKRYLGESKLEVLSFGAASVTFILAVVSSIIVNNQIISYTLFFAFFSFLVIYAISSMVSNFRFLIGATKETMINIKSRFNDDLYVANEVSKYKVESIEHVSKLLEHRISFLNARVGFLVGIVDKLGIVPAIIMIYFAYIRTSGDMEVADLSPFVIGIVAGVYLGALTARVIIDSLKDKVAILTLASEISSSKLLKLP